MVSGKRFNVTLFIHFLSWIAVVSFKSVVINVKLGNIEYRVVTFYIRVLSDIFCPMQKHKYLYTQTLFWEQEENSCRTYLTFHTSPTLPPASCPPIMVTEMLVCSLNHVTYFSCDMSCGLDEIRQRGLKGTTKVGREGGAPTFFYPLSDGLHPEFSFY